MINPQSQEAKDYMIALFDLYLKMKDSFLEGYRVFVQSSPYYHDCPLAGTARRKFFELEQDETILIQLKNLLEKRKNLIDNKDKNDAELELQELING